MTDNWNVKIESKDCPHKVYPTHTLNSKWQKGYCGIYQKEEKDVECDCNNCPLRVR